MQISAFLKVKLGSVLAMEQITAHRRTSPIYEMTSD